MCLPELGGCPTQHKKRVGVGFAVPCRESRRDLRVSWAPPNDRGRRNESPGQQSLKLWRIYNREKQLREEDLNHNAPRNQNDPPCKTGGQAFTLPFLVVDSLMLLAQACPCAGGERQMPRGLGTASSRGFRGPDLELSFNDGIHRRFRRRLKFGGTSVSVDYPERRARHTLREPS